MLIPVSALSVSLVTLQNPADVTQEIMHDAEIKPADIPESPMKDVQVPEISVRRSAERSRPQSEQRDNTAEKERAQPLSPKVNASKNELPLEASYRKVSDVDTAPFPLGEIDPEYPNAGGITEGYVELLILISERGKVDRVDVLGSFPPGLFDQSAFTAFSNATFSPGILGGLPVKTQMTIRVRFSPDTQEHELSGRGY